jgi:hypothetical protein
MIAYLRWAWRELWDGIGWMYTLADPGGGHGR